MFWLMAVLVVGAIVGGTLTGRSPYVPVGWVSLMFCLGLCLPGQAAKIPAQAPLFFDLPPDFLPKDVSACPSLISVAPSCTVSIQPRTA